MQITSRFTIAVHVLACVACFKEKRNMTSKLLAGSIGANPVIVRNVMSSLKEAGIIYTSRGRSGMEIVRPLDEITFYDVYRAVDAADEGGLFHFHEKANAACPVGRHIRSVMGRPLQRVQDAMEAEMKTISIGEIVAQIRAAYCAEQRESERENPLPKA